MYPPGSSLELSSDDDAGVAVSTSLGSSLPHSRSTCLAKPLTLATLHARLFPMLRMMRNLAPRKLDGALHPRSLVTDAKSVCHVIVRLDETELSVSRWETYRPKLPNKVWGILFCVLSRELLLLRFGPIRPERWSISASLVSSNINALPYSCFVCLGTRRDQPPGRAR